MIASPYTPKCVGAWNAVAFRFWAAYLAHRLEYGGTTPRWLARYAATFDGLRWTVLYSLSVVLISLMSFSQEAPRPTAANVDQGASVKKKKHGAECEAAGESCSQCGAAKSGRCTKATRQAASAPANGTALRPA